ncbi:hypothetical protein IVB23_27635 [Bradyrhizobium sp. 191]|nr:hypothetical protein IVB23_27635 [Bradyrhizobium sp. 191]
MLESALVGLPHPDFGEGAVAVAVPTAGGAARETDIVAVLKGRLAAYKLPNRDFCVSELPRNTMGRDSEERVARALRRGVQRIEGQRPGQGNGGRQFNTSIGQSICSSGSLRKPQ